MCDIYEKFRNSNNERTIRSIIGLSKPQFDNLVIKFVDAHNEAQQERINNGEIKILPRGGNKGNLDSLEKELFFILFYLKVYCTFDALGFIFGFSGGTAHDHVKQILPILERALQKLNVLPLQEIKTLDDMNKAIDSYDKLIIDCVEISCVRPQDDVKQREYYSGKKKKHTLKSLVISDTHKMIIFVSIFVAGSIHDYALMKRLFDPSLDWFGNINILLDLGFYGANKEYSNGDNFILPNKKPKKSSKNPNPTLTQKQKKENRLHAATRVLVEHSIGGMKYFFCLTHRVRNHLDILKNYFICLCAGLWNLKLSY